MVNKQDIVRQYAADCYTILFVFVFWEALRLRQIFIFQESSGWEQRRRKVVWICILHKLQEMFIDPLQMEICTFSKHEPYIF